MKHYLSLFSSPYLAAWDIADGDLSVTVAAVESVKLKNRQNKEESKGLVKFSEPGVKPMVLNKTNGAVLAQMYGSDPERWIGLPVTLYATTCEVGGEIKPCIRVRLVVARPSAALPPAERTAPAPHTSPAPRAAQGATPAAANGSKKSKVA